MEKQIEAGSDYSISVTERTDGIFDVELGQEAHETLSRAAAAAGQTLEEFMSAVAGEQVKALVARHNLAETVADQLLGPCSHCEGELGELALTVSSLCESDTCGGTHQLSCDLSRSELVQLLLNLPPGRELDLRNAAGNQLEVEPCRPLFFR